MAMPSNEYQVAGWAIAVTIPIMILGWIGDLLGKTWQIISTNAPTALILLACGYVMFRILRTSVREARQGWQETKVEWQEMKQEAKQEWAKHFGKKPDPEASTDGSHQQKTDSKHQENDDFDPSRFGAKAPQDLPYGVDKRHKEDFPLWAYVDDSNAPPPLRREALEKILKREAGRKGLTGREVAI